MQRLIILTFYLWGSSLAESLRSLMPNQSPLYEYAEFIETSKELWAYEFDAPVATGRAFGDIYQVHEKEAPEKIFAMKLILVIDTALLINGDPCWNYERQLQLSAKNTHILPVKTIQLNNGKKNVSFCVVISPLALMVFDMPLFNIDQHASKTDGSLTEAEFRAYKKTNTEALGIFLAEIISGVFELHDQKFVHNDLKPSNILLVLDSNQVPHAMINDFDVAFDFQLSLDNKKYQSILSMLKNDKQKIKECIRIIIQTNNASIISENLEDYFHRLIDQGYEKLFEQYDKPDEKPKSSLIRRNTLQNRTITKIII